MMAKNVAEYIDDAISTLQKESEVPWELVIVDDHSDDDTYNKAKQYADKDNRIILVKNKFKGKVLGTNFGYTLTSGDIIKCIDSDDVIKLDYFKKYDEMKNYDAHCHSALVVDNNLNNLSVYNVNYDYLSSTYKDVINNLISLPKWAWSFKREIADKIFPMPSNLPFEDVWISILIKKFSKSILNIDEPLYLYRQHSRQTFGGILNYDINMVVFRANRLIKLIDIIKNEHVYLIDSIENPFSDIGVYLYLQSNKASVLKILSTKLDLIKKIKLILIIHFPKTAVNTMKIKWMFDKLK